MPEQSQSTATGDGGAHGRVVRESFYDSGQIRFRLEKMVEKIPIILRCGGGGVNCISGLGEPDEMLTEDAAPGISHALPAENLAGI